MLPHALQLHLKIYEKNVAVFTLVPDETSFLVARLTKLVPGQSTLCSFGPTFSQLVFTQRPHSVVFGIFIPWIRSGDFCDRPNGAPGSECSGCSGWGLALGSQFTLLGWAACCSGMNVGLAAGTRGSRCSLTILYVCDFRQVTSPPCFTSVTKTGKSIRSLWVVWRIHWFLKCVCVCKSNS